MPHNVMPLQHPLNMAKIHVLTTGPALLENNEASAKLTTANGGTFRAYF